MQTFLIILGVLFLGLLFILLVGIIRLFCWLPSFSKTLEGVVDSTISAMGSISNVNNYLNTYIPMIIDNWNVQELLKRATPEFINSSETEEIEKDFEIYLQSLGKMKEFQGIQHYEVNNYGGNYTIMAKFEHGQAEIHVQVIEHNQEWLINYFKIHRSLIIDKGV